MMALADIEKPEILPGENILAVKEPRGVMVEFNRYEIEHDSFGGFIPVRCWVTDDFNWYSTSSPVMNFTIAVMTK